MVSTPKMILRFPMLLVLLAQCAFSQVDVVYSDLVWSDEFDINGTVNASKWHHQTQIPSGGSWFNGEVQHYTSQPSNSFVNNGMLSITAIKEPFTADGVTKEYTSARLNSKFAFKYGRVDVRAKLPVVPGTWPAIWMLGRNVNEDGGYFDATYGNMPWPACGEIDILEYGIFPTQPVNYIQSTLHTPSSNGNSINHGGTIASDLQNNFHIYSMNWSPNQISFLLDGVVYYTYNPAVKNPSTWPFDAEQYLLLNVAMGGIAGAIPANFSQASMLIDYVRVYQNTVADTQGPVNFTAATGVATSSSIELLLNAQDNSGTVVYTVSYGSTTMSYTLPAGAQTVVITNLDPATDYNFTITATDTSGNPSANNPIVLNAQTTSYTGCTGTDTQAQQGTFAIGYNYDFETTGNDVKVTFEMLDTAPVGVVAYLWKQTPFTETPMSNVSGNVFTHTLTGQTIGSTINYAVKFAFAGGLAVTRYISYVVGSNCSLGTPNQSDAGQYSFRNPAKDSLQIHSPGAIDKIEIYDLPGSKVTTAIKTDRISLRNLRDGIYIVIIYSGTNRIFKKLVVDSVD